MLGRRSQKALVPRALDAPILSQNQTPSAILQQRYVDALLACGNPTDLAPDIANAANLIDSSADLQSVLSSPIIPLAGQLQAVTAVFKTAKIAPIVQSFAAVVLNNRRGSYLSAFLHAGLAEIEKRAGRMIAQVQVASPLSAPQQQRLVDKLSAWSGTQVALDVLTTPDILGGMKIRLGSTQIDDSVAGKLARLQKNLLGRADAA